MSSPPNPNQEEPPLQGYAEHARVPSQEDSHNQIITDVPARTLSPISPNPMNLRGPISADNTKLPIANTYGSREPNNFEGYYGEEGPTTGVGLTASNSIMMPSSSSRMNGATSSPYAHASPDRPPPPPPRAAAIPMSTTVRNISAGFGGSRGTATNGFTVAEDNTTEQNDSQVWSSAVGKANLGKSGRVIEKLMGEKDKLKRDLTVQKLQAEEARNELKMAEMKMNQMTTEYETKLHDAAINKTLLKRRERQVVDLKSQIDGEKHRADTAVESERNWKTQMEKTERECKEKVDEANNHVMLVEGRYKALASHWDQQRHELNGTVTKVSKEISSLANKQLKDRELINSLQTTCDQQNAQLDNLQKEKEEIAEAFRLYKLEQEKGLKDIKETAARQEKENEEKIAEATKVLGELKWALQVKKNVRDAV